MLRARIPLMLLTLLLALSLAACAERATEDEDSTAGDRPVPTPVPTEPIDDGEADDADDALDDQPSPTPVPTQPDADPTATPGEGNGEWFQLLETDKTYPEDEVGEEILVLAESSEEFEDWQQRFQLDDIPGAEGIDWGQQAVLFAGTGESGSCPIELVDVEFVDGDRLINVMASREGDEDMMCTMDWTPRVFVIALELDVLGDGELFGAITDPQFDEEIDPEQWQSIRD